MEGTAELFTGFAERIAREKGTQQEMMREGDYIEDGLIHCGKCRGKRQTRVKSPAVMGQPLRFLVSVNARQRQKRIERSRKRPDRNYSAWNACGQQVLLRTD